MTFQYSPQAYNHNLVPLKWCPLAKCPPSIPVYNRFCSGPPFSTSDSPSKAGAPWCSSHWQKHQKANSSTTPASYSNPPSLNHKIQIPPLTLPAILPNEIKELHLCHPLLRLIEKHLGHIKLLQIINTVIPLIINLNSFHPLPTQILHTILHRKLN